MMIYVEEKKKRRAFNGNNINQEYMSLITKDEQIPLRYRIPSIPVARRMVV